MNKIPVFLLLLAACSQPTTQPTISTAFQPVPDALCFYTIGDWGRQGEYGQQELAHTMGLAAYQVEPEFIISTGDNFYPNGVSSTADPQWTSSFENVYRAHSLNVDWYVVPGNHDYRGNVQAQIDYTNVSRRWNMPARYFHREFTTDDGALVRFVFTDTNPLNDDYYGESKYRDKVMGQDTTAQLRWIDSLLALPAHWKIVVGHHPLYTGGKRADVPNAIRQHLEPLLDKHGVHAYLAGHEHDLQHIQPAGHPTHHWVSGAGSEVRPTGQLESTRFARSVQGFLATFVTREALTFQFVDWEGQVIYTAEVKRD